MQSGHRYFARGVEARNRSRGVEVGDHAAAHIMRGRNHRNRFFGQIKSVAEASLIDVGKALADEPGVAMTQIQINAIEAVALHLGIDRAGDDIARRQLRVGGVALHERRAVGELQDRALAAQRLRDQK